MSCGLAHEYSCWPSCRQPPIRAELSSQARIYRIQGLLNLLLRWREDLLNEFQEALGVECRVNCGDGEGIELKRFVCVFNLFTHVVVLQYINNTQVKNNVICLRKHLYFLYPRNLFCPCWHIHTKLDLESAQDVRKKISIQILKENKNVPLSCLLITQHEYF